jgi:oligoendopeptidase F
VPEHLKWDLTAIFADSAAFEACFSECQSLIPGLAAYKGRLNRTGKVLLEALEYDQKVDNMLSRLFFYAQLKYTENAADQAVKAQLDRVKSLMKSAAETGSFFSVQLGRIKAERFANFTKTTPGLAIYAHYFEKLRIKQAHVRSPEVEELLAQMGDVLSGPSDLYDIFDTVILPDHMPEVITGGGEKIKLNDQVYAVGLESQDREVRKQAWEGMMKAFGAFGPMLAQNYLTRVKAAAFVTKAARYGSTLERALAGPHLPIAVYDSLVQTVRANLPSVQRYLSLRKKLLGVEELHMYDQYVPLVGSVDGKATYEEGKVMVLDALTPLGEDYVGRATRLLSARRTDVMPNKGKAGGAFSWGIWGVTPFMLLNWAGRLDDVSTLAHELGHNIHSEHAQDQHYINAGYPTFCAEVASTVNEQLLSHRLLQTTTDRARRLFLLNHELEAVRRTIVRQTLFAEFEREVHALVEAEKPVTHDDLCAIYKRLNEEYYGPAVAVDDLVKHEWSRIPHFMNPFYVYTYATGLSSAITIADKIIKEGKPAAEAYLGFLKDGNSKFPLDSLRAAGSDLSTPAPVDRAFRHFDAVLDEFEREIEALEKPAA